MPQRGILQARWKTDGRFWAVQWLKGGAVSGCLFAEGLTILMGHGTTATEKEKCHCIICVCHCY